MTHPHRLPQYPAWLPHFILLLLTPLLLASKAPSLTPETTKNKIEEITKAHAEIRRLTPEVVERILINFVEELDPQKTYFLEEELTDWVHPSKETLEKAFRSIKKADFSLFEGLYHYLAVAIERHREVEKEAATLPFPAGVQPIEFKDLSWCKTRDELLTRLSRIRALQMDSISILEEKAQSMLLQKLQKLQLKHEEELFPADPSERKRTALAYVLKATASALDSQTNYFTPSEALQFIIQVQQKLYGIGAQLRDDLNGFTVVRILEGSPASKDNTLRMGDRIIAVNQEPVVGMDIWEAVELIRGPEHTPVILTVVREAISEEAPKEERLNIHLTRGEIVLKESRYNTVWEPFADGGIGVLQLYSFYQDETSSSAEDLSQAIASMRNQNVKAIILDLRSNPGGLLPQAVSVSGLFLKKGIIVSVKDNTGEVHHLHNIEEKTAWDGPLIVLTNRASASASEIVAQTLKDYGRAILVGDSDTFGKGTFQSFTLESTNYGKVNPQGEYKVTRGKWYSVSGRCPQLQGVETQILVPGPFSEMEIGEKFSKYPLQPDSIPPNYDDTLADIPWVQRPYVSRIYKFDLQEVLHTYDPWLSILQASSKTRIAQNDDYQTFIQSLQKKDNLGESFEKFGQNDLQLSETLQIAKDLIFLMEETARKEQSGKEAA